MVIKSILQLKGKVKMREKWNRLEFTQRFALTSLFVFLLVLPVAVYLALSPTSPFSKAGPGCTISAPGCSPETPATLSFQPDSVDVGYSQDFSVDIMLDTGSHSVAAAEIVLTYNHNLLQPKKTGTVVYGEFLPVVLEKLDIANQYTNTIQGGAPSPPNPPPFSTLRFAVGSNPNNPVSGYGKVATVTFNTFDYEEVTELSLSDGSQVAAIYKQVNVASNFYPAKVNIQKSLPTGTLLLKQLEFEAIDKTSNVESVPVSIEFIPETPVATGSGMLTGKKTYALARGDGTFDAQVSGLIPNKYKVFVKGDRYLRKSVGVMSVQAGSTALNPYPSTGNVTLTAGDAADDNNIVDIFDYSVVVQDFGPKMPMEGSPADFDYDQDVDIFDYSFIVQNFGNAGD